MRTIEALTVDRPLIIYVFWPSTLKHPVVMLRSRQRKNVVDKEAVLHGRDRQVDIL
ncbi:MAG: hypothetical protein JGK17_29215 [Microcoleus sp. PH2017_10_PVI_O_A]|uniref:hypothetical protein n=1 Tax=unclassified Microcoleus TaxID=2642155 RepID=UPI001D944D0C|nr:MULTISPECIES: hypothetical protein [unclassified Microcoleus]MCC3409561.1 hypothetical protein [Microcoleus sp. PH2017_10_PVI_O_A]MCC3463800.1 hypothetical protein [Microcoleus sp. PH2017_11_PCY_U_A]MCC3482142.1 hypothetical protein [Microcoleus sp. PH2017_12_PCY_D_A]MCC3528167.1 hypothetical protein [Microcoleus sp. PH2017_21_RUC_O_A]MCC3540194.1 hypothetical protein [Microcoleus sp. PH2017_22_RUC_O_B]